MAKLVFSYSHVDEALRDELEKHLTPLKRLGEIETWHDRRIGAGDEFERAIDRHFTEADIVLLLVSSDFIASDYCYEIEMTNALERHDLGQARVVPVILRECQWHRMPFGRLKAATLDGKPVTKFATLDEGFSEVAGAISKIVDELNKLDQASTEGQELEVNKYQNSVLSKDAEPVLSSVTVAPTRSSNMAIKKEFTEQDKGNAVLEGFDFAARYFENSLKEIVVRHPELNESFRRIDANSFESAIYLNGNKACFCGIWLSSSYGRSEIRFSTSGVSGGSYNESIHTEDDGHILGFKPTMNVFGVMANQDSLLTEEGFSEYLWSQFIEPLK